MAAITGDIIGRLPKLAIKFPRLRHTLTGIEKLPDTWDPSVYRERAKAWREKAASLPEHDPNRAPCLELAEGYEKLADQLDLRSRPERSPGRP